MRLFLILCLGAASCFVCLTCGGNVAGNSVLEGSSQKESLIKQINVRSSSITETHPSQWKVGPVRLDERIAFSSIFFLDSNTGWVGGEGALYKTVDGGNTWERVIISIPPAAEVSSIYFANPSVGWVAIQKHAPSVTSYGENQFWLMQTTDGGRNWQQQSEYKDVVVRDLFFVDEHQGWATGTKYIGLSPLRYAPFALHTSDQGRHWTEVSTALNTLAKDETEVINDGIVGIFSERPSSSTILTSRGNFLKTVNAGQTWQKIGETRDVLPIRLSRLGGRKNGRLWFAGGAYSVEGIRSTLSVEQDDGTWIKYKLGGVYFADALFISEKSVFACGSIPLDKNNQSRRAGVILSSSDGGQNWSIIYRNTEIDRINSIAVADAEHLWAVGDDGFIFRIGPV